MKPAQLFYSFNSTLGSNLSFKYQMSSMQTFHVLLHKFHSLSISTPICHPFRPIFFERYVAPPLQVNLSIVFNNERDKTLILLVLGLNCYLFAYFPDAPNEGVYMVCGVLIAMILVALIIVLLAVTIR